MRRLVPAGQTRLLRKAEPDYEVFITADQNLYPSRIYRRTSPRHQPTIP